MPKPSAIWEINLFKKLNVDQAECKQCKEDGRETIIIPRKGGNTKGLITHLENSHKDSSYHKKYIELTMKILNVNAHWMILLKLETEIAIAQMLDPRIKDRNTEFPEIFQRSVLNWLESLDKDECITEDLDEPICPIAPKRARVGLLGDIEEMMANKDLERPTTLQSLPNLRTQFVDYVGLSRESMDTDPLEFWKKMN
uniref:BED-type domain-containing protein n=1 Tax=Meloidogyne hapla TaxID=6305 RepID=A0A1I8BKN5_MELHA